jgi:catechol 2,3-dioxygenase-like lactoylglutathione lyase family enzyme
MESTRDIIIQTNKFTEAIHFYKNVMRFPVTQQSEKLLGFETGSFCLYVEPGSVDGPVLEFHVADVEAAKKELVAAGCRIEEEDPSVPRCYLRDPFGLVFNLSS